MATADNLKIAQQLLATMQQITAQVEKQSETYRTQIQLVEALCKAQECGKESGSKVKELSDAFDKAKEKSTSFASSIKDAENNTGRLSKTTSKVSKAVNILKMPAEFLNGLKSAFNFAENIGRGLLRLGGPVFGLMKNLGGIFKSLPGRVMDFFQGAAAGGMDPYRGALEEVREEFGNLEISTSAAIVGMTEDMKGLGASGLKMGQVFGYGREGLANLLRENLEIAKGMGPVFKDFAASLNGAYSEFTVLRKATNLSAEAFKSLHLSAQDAGISTGEAVLNMSKDIARAEKTFGITAKEYGKDLDFMMKDTATFGVMAPKEMLRVSTYARKLGLSMETLKKVTEKSLNFEDAAQQSAKLSEAFGIQVDAIKLMNASPTEKIDMLRQSFFKAGKSIENMTVLEKRYLTEQTAMSEEELRLAFAQKNRSLTQAQINAQAKKGEKTPITQAEAMEQLAKSIKRTQQAAQTFQGSFMSLFVKGFFEGIQRTKAFRDVVVALQRTMKIMISAGREVGRSFVEFFPGIKDILIGFKELFDPRRYKVLMDNVVAEFRMFFYMLNHDPEAGFQMFTTNMTKHFRDFFGGGSQASKKILDGVKKFFTIVGKIFIAGIKFALNKVVDFFNLIADTINNPRSVMTASRQVGTGISGMLSEAFDYAIKQIGPVLPKIIKAFTRIVKAINEKLKAVFNPATGGLKGFIQRMLNPSNTPPATEAQSALGKLWNDMKGPLIELLKELWITVKTVGAPLLESAGDLLGKLFAFGIAKALITSAAKAALESSMKLLFNVVKGPLLNLLGGISGSTAGIVAIVVAIVALTAAFYTNSKAAAAFQKKVGDMLNKVGEYVGLAIGYILKGLWTLISLGPKMLISVFTDGKFARKILGSVIAAFMSIGNWIIQFFGGLLVGILKALGFEDLSKKVKDWLANFSKEMHEFTANIHQYFKEIWDFINDGFIIPFKNAIKSAWKSMTDAYNQYVTPVINYVKNFVNIIIADIGRIVAWFREHNPFAAIGNAMSTVANVANRIFGHSINTVVNADMQKINKNMEKNDPFARIGDAAENAASRAKAASTQIKTATVTAVPEINMKAPLIKSPSNIPALKGISTGIEDVQLMVKAYNNFSVELSKLNAATGNNGPINVALARFGQVLQGGRVAKIENAAVKAEINVQVRMDAGDLVNAFVTQAQRRTATGSLIKPAFRISSINLPNANIE